MEKEVKDFSMQNDVFKGKAEVSGHFTYPLPGTSNLYKCYSSEVIVIYIMHAGTIAHMKDYLICPRMRSFFLLYSLHRAILAKE